MLFEIAVLGKCIYDLNESSENNRIAEKSTIKANKSIAKQKQMVHNSASDLEKSLEKLCARRDSIYKATFPLFLKVMKPLDKVEMNNTQLATLNEVKNSVTEYQRVRNGFDEVKISTPNVTQSGYIGAYLLEGIPGIIKKNSESKLKQAHAINRVASAYESHSETLIEFFQYTSKQCDIMSDLITKFNLLLIRALNNINPVICEKQENKTLYTLQDRQNLRLCFNMVDALKKIVNTNIMENDELSESFVQAIDYGHNQLIEINKLINEYNDI